jgi:methionyl-tRNA formyltransferase
MRIVFLGSGEVALPALSLIAQQPAMELVAVVTQPDRPRGRHLQPAPCPAKHWARSIGVPVLSPEKIGDPVAVAELAALAPDLIVVAAYGQFIPDAVRLMPPLGSINIHPSLLPKYRGAAPIQWAIADGCTETGVTILYVSAAMDAGDILAQRRVPIAPTDTTASLTPTLSRIGGELLVEVIGGLQAGTLTARPQDEAAATTVYKLKKEDGRIDWRLPAQTLVNRLRGFTPWPGLFTQADERLVKVLAAEAVAMPQEAEAEQPGTILTLAAGEPLVVTGEGALCLQQVQPAGKKAMSGADFVRGYRVTRFQ